MTNPTHIDASTLVLKMVGGKLDGKLLPISTQKCFLTGGQKENKDQCAIVRGPSGTAIKSTEQIVVNDHYDTLHWLSEGDTIRIGQTVMVVEQLGNFGQTTTDVAPEKSEIGASHVATPAVSQTNKQNTHSQPVPAAPRIESPAMDSSLQSAEMPQESEAPIADATETAAKPQPQLEQILASLQTTEEACDNETGLDQAENAGEDDSHSALQEFLNSKQTPSASEMPSAPSEDEVREPESHTPDPRMNNELLERALQSLKNPSEELATIPSEQTEAAVEQTELSTEENVDQQLDEIQHQLESQIQSYDSAPQIPESIEPAVDTIEDPVADEISNEANSVIEEVDARAEPVEDIMARLRAANRPQIENEAQPELPAMNPVQEETPLEQVLQSEPAEVEKTTAPVNSIEDIMNRLGATNSEPQSQEPLEEPTQTVEETAQVIDSPFIENPVPSLPPADEFEEQHVGMQLPVESHQETEVALPETVEPSESSVKEVAPTVPEELITPTPDEQSSVAAVLARMQSSGKLNDYSIPSEEPSETLEQPSQPVVEPSQPSVEPTQTAPATPEKVGEGGGDIKDYMNQLFQRLRGSDAPASALPESTEEPAPIQADESVFSMEIPKKEVERILTSTEYVPQQQAPEEKSHMDAMRQLANEQKHAAVQICSSKKSQVEQAINQCVGLSSFVASAVLGWMANSTSDPLAIASFGCGVASLIAGYRYVAGVKAANKAAIFPEQPAPTEEQEAELVQ